VGLKLRVAHAGRPVAPETVCGDQAGVIHDGSRTILVLADGLGHGEAAEAAARRAVDYVRENVASGPAELLRGCNVALRGTRGAAVTIISVDTERAELVHAGVGNVELVALSREPIRPLALGGIVGARMRKVVETTHRLHAGDMVVLHTDGISTRLALAPYRGLEPRAIADAILSAYAKAHDDAACLVLRV
jgi:serine phosphatase RsbU (regulator of sigma subunit)